MKKFISIFTILICAFILFAVPVYAEGEPITVEIPVSIEKGEGTIKIEGEKNLPEITEIHNSGSFTITYEDPRAGDIYYYTISEILGDDVNTVYDKTVYECRVYFSFVDAEEKTLAATVVINKLNEETKPDSVDFINNPVTPCSVDPPLKKTVKNDPTNKNKYEFVLKAVSNTAGFAVEDMPLPEGAHSEFKKTITGNTETEFGEYILPRVGQYVYEVYEVDGKIPTITYDKAVYTAIYDVEREGDHLVVAKTTYKKNNTVIDKQVFEFINTYTSPVEELINTGTGRALLIAGAVLIVASGALIIINRRKNNK